MSLFCGALEETAYCWEKQNSSIPPGATGVHSNTLTIVNLLCDYSGDYRCVVSNDNGKSYSDWATVTING